MEQPACAAPVSERVHPRIERLTRETLGTRAIHYECQRCTNCCRWPGFVKVSEPEMARIAEHLGIGEDDFIQRYTRLRPQRDGLALIDKGDSHECIFLEGRDCAIQAVKPVKCAGFPNAWNFPAWRESCEAVPVLRAE